MYNKYKFDVDKKSVWATGDVHGEWGLLRYLVKTSGIEDAIIIVAGDCGFGFEKEQHYIDTYKHSIKPVLDKQNVTLLFVRGNHDDPEYFDGTRIDYPNFKAIPDYSVISACDINILTIGGAISVDRQIRIAANNQAISQGSSRRVYWENEFPIYKPEILDKITNDGIKIDSIITHTSPSFAPLTNKYGIKTFMLYDTKLDEDTNNERNTMSNIYNHLINGNKQPITKWIYGHFHEHNQYISNDNVEFTMLDMFRNRNNGWDVKEISKKD